MSIVYMAGRGDYWTERGGMSMDAGFVPGIDGGVTASSGDHFATYQIELDTIGFATSVWDVRGQDLTYGADPFDGPTGGTITGYYYWRLIKAVPPPPPGADMFQYAKGLSDFWVSLDAPAALTTGIRDADAFWKMTIGGNDTFTISSNTWKSFAGDGSTVHAGGDVTGGSDAMTFSYNKPDPALLDLFIPREPKIYAGDFLRVEASSKLTGGADIMDWTKTGIAAAVGGDAIEARGTLIGGDDSFDASAVAKQALAGIQHTATTGSVTIMGMVISGDSDTGYAFVDGGDDLILGSTLSDLLVGDVRRLADNVASLKGGDDEIHGGEGADYIFGDFSRAALGALIGGGNDKLFGDGGDDELWGNDGGDVLDGGTGNDYLDGDTGNDTLRGGAGADRAFGRDGNDTFLIREGDLDGGQDGFVGGSGIDRVVFEASGGDGGIADLRGHILQSIEEIGLASDGSGVITDVQLLASQFVDGFTVKGAIIGTAEPGNADLVEVFMDYIQTLDLHQLQRVNFNDPLDRLVVNGDDDGELITGTTGQDALHGHGGADELHGDSGNDLMTGDDGDDHLDGDAGDDTLTGGEGNDSMGGEDGQDRMFGNAGLDAMLGGSGADYMDGGDDDDQMSGDDGNDTLLGGLGNDGLFGAAGDDSLVGGAGDDQFFGGEGNDTADYRDASKGVTLVLDASGAGTFAVTGLGTDTYDSIENLAGSVFNDRLTGNGGGNALDGGGGNDVLQGGAGDDTLKGGAGKDTASYADADFDLTLSLVGGVADAGALGTDTLSGIENLDGGSGNDALTAGKGRNVLSGNDGNDTLNGGKGRDVMAGGDGNDTYFVNVNGEKVIEATAKGYDTVIANTSFVLTANAEVEVIEARGNKGIGLTGNALGQAVTGNDANNSLDGGGGADVLTGNGGADNFVFSEAPSNGDVVLLADFTLGDDSILLSSTAFAALGPTGLLAGTLFAANSGGVATTAEQRILYDLDTGLISYDADGSDAGAAVAFALAAGAPVLLAGDFQVV